MSKKIKTSNMYYERWNSMIEFVNTVRHRDLSPNWIGKNCGVVMDRAHRSCHGDLLTGTDDIVRPMKFYARHDGRKYSYEETIDYCINGTDMFNDMIGRNKYKIPFSMAVAPRKQKNNNIAGQQVNVPRYLNNTPANMFMSRKQDEPKQAINIVFDTDCNWTTPVINRVQCGVNILKAVQALTIAVYDVQLDVMPFCSYSETTRKLYMTTIRLKDYGENVNMNRLAYPIAAVASQFHLGVDWMQRVPDSPYMLAAGWPVYPNEKRYDEIKDYFKNKHDAFFIGLHEMNLLEADKDTDKSVDNLIQYLTGKEVERRGGYKTGYAVKQAGGTHIRAYNDEFMDFNENIDDITTVDNPDANNTEWTDDFKETDGIMNENHENITETNGTSESNRNYNNAQTNNDIGLNDDRNDSNQNESEKNNTTDSIDSTESDNTASAEDKQDSMDASHSDADDESSHELTDRQNNNVQDTDSTMDDDMNSSNGESNSQQDDSNESTANNTKHDDEQSGSDNETDESMNTGSIKQDSDNETDESSNAQSDFNSESSNHADEQSGKQVNSNSDNFTALQDTDSTEQRSSNSQDKDSKNEPQSDNGEQNQNNDSSTSSDNEQQWQDSQSDNQNESAGEQNQEDSDSQSDKQDDSNKSNDNIEDSQEQDEHEPNDDIDEPEPDMNDEITLDDVLNGDADGAPLKYDYESFIEWLKRVYDWLQKANRK